MEMSGDYLRQSAQWLASVGYTLKEELPDAEPGTPVCVRYHLSRGEEEHFVLECLRYEDGSERYYLEIMRYYAMRAFSFPLDSWKHFKDRVEFKFYALDEPPLGLSFILARPPAPEEQAE